MPDAQPSRPDPTSSISWPIDMRRNGTFDAIAMLRTKSYPGSCTIAACLHVAQWLRIVHGDKPHWLQVIESHSLTGC